MFTVSVAAPDRNLLTLAEIKSALGVIRAKVQASLDDPRPSIPHDEVVAKIRAKIEHAIASQKKSA